MDDRPQEENNGLPTNEKIKGEEDNGPWTTDHRKNLRQKRIGWRKTVS